MDRVVAVGGAGRASVEANEPAIGAGPLAWRIMGGVAEEAGNAGATVGDRAEAADAPRFTGESAAAG